jgi:hypothetical protein
VLNQLCISSSLQRDNTAHGSNVRVPSGWVPCNFDHERSAPKKLDGTDFAVTRIEGEPAQNPSFWTKKSEIHHEYKKVQAFWLPARNESVSYIRLGGRATLTIEYKDYRVTDARQAKR